MKIKGEEKIRINNNLTLRNLESGEVFAFEGGEYRGLPMMTTDNDYIIILETGEALDECEFYNTPVKRVRCHLVIEED